MKVTNGNNMFYGCTNLATITFPGSSSFPLSYVGFENCNNLTSDTIANILDALYDFTNDPSSLADNGITYSKKVKFSRTAYDALTEDQIKTATDKGWTVERA